jgi:hypothetical protein
LFYQLIHL